MLMLVFNIILTVVASSFMPLLTDYVVIIGGLVMFFAVSCAVLYVKPTHRVDGKQHKEETP